MLFCFDLILFCLAFLLSVCLFHLLFFKDGIYVPTSDFIAIREISYHGLILELPTNQTSKLIESADSLHLCTMYTNSSHIGHFWSLHL